MEEKKLISQIRSVKKNSGVKMICDMTGKDYFVDQKSAKEKMREIQNLDNSAIKPIRVYECNLCNGWHMTSKPHPKFQNNEIRSRDTKKGTFESKSFRKGKKRDK